MIRTITIQEYFALDPAPVLIDVRTPAEHAQGHVPGAASLPLFTNEERVAVGTTYKQMSREAAILLGFDLVGPRWSQLVRDALVLAPDKRIAVHCWRGGMRSGAVAWALDLYGFEVYLIRGGYKAYRAWTRERFETAYRLCLLGGMTGSGKTLLLQRLADCGRQTIDLEALAQHRGSAFGSLNRLVQPSQEQFENDFAHQLAAVNPHELLFVEDESLKIGLRAIPAAFWEQMKSAPVVALQLPLPERVGLLLQEYGALDKTFLTECTLRIQKRLGPEQTKHAVQALAEDRMGDFIRLVLSYYDKAYRKGLSVRDAGRIFPLDIQGAGTEAVMRQFLDFVTSLPEIS